MQALLAEQQMEICAALESLDGTGRFRHDPWQRPGGGGGTTCVLADGDLFEKAGVNVSQVYGELSEEAASQVGGGHSLVGPDSRQFFACGLSLVLHPRHPMVPTVHANYRYFERGDGQAPGAWWFGGGSDLTPTYLYEQDAQHFHQTLKGACDRIDPLFYPRFKAWCDRYFWIPHRAEARGIGGIFFDNLCDRPKATLFAFIAGCLRAFLPSYVPIVQRRRTEAYEPAHSRWQQLRRGRYVEFNLVYDRGTSFGLRTGGRTESILMSLPAVASWQYDYRCTDGSREAALQSVLAAPRSWADPDRPAGPPPA